MLGFIELCQDTDRHTVTKARDLSKHAFRFTWNLCGEQVGLGGGESVVVCC